MKRSPGKIRTTLASAAAMVILTSASGGDGLGVLADFRHEVAQQGLLLAKFNNSRVTILLAGSGKEQNLRLRPEYSVYQFASSASGRCIAFSVDQTINSSNDVLRDTIFTVGADGEVRSTKGHFATVKGLALSLDCHKLAINGLYQDIDPLNLEIKSARAGLFLADVGSGRANVKLISEVSEAQNYPGVSDAVFGVSWSPNNSSIAYSADGAIRTYNIMSGETKFLVSGRNPAWSPDGNWLGYQGPDGAPMLLNLSTRLAEPLVAQAKCLWSIKWSPDSRFTIFTQYDRVGTVFQVCRLKDRAVAPIYRSGAQYTESRFAWVTRSGLAALLAAGELMKLDL